MNRSSQLRILHVVGSLNQTWGGLSLFVAELAGELAAQGHQVQVLCPPGQAAQRWPAGTAEVVQARAGSPQWNAALEAASLVHVHGLWLPFCHRALAVARNQQKPHLLSIHGMLEPGALRFSRWKKRLALWLYQRADLCRAPALHATVQSEKQTLRGFGLRQPVVILPPGVRLPEASALTAGLPQTRRALFIGRIHPKKGILELLDAWAAVRPQGWQLDLAGPDEAGHLRQVQQRLRERNLQNEVLYHGPAFGAAKEKLLQAASLLVVPSLSENFGIVVAEGLAYGLPVIATTGTPWQILPREGCGWWIPFGEKALAQTLQQVVALSPEKLREMGLRGRGLAAREFGWPGLAAHMSRVYLWLAGGQEPPQCVHAD